MHPSKPPQRCKRRTTKAKASILAEYWDILVDNRWLVAAVVAVFLFLGMAYALLGKPVYEGNLAVQVEDSGNSAGSFLGDAASSLLSVKTPAAGEIEILRSRAILGKAVENTKLYISARPRYAPFVGSYLSRRATDLSEPGFMGLAGYVTGTEKHPRAALRRAARFRGTSRSS
jgi:tyrosine-protein kinase Etk/Wzc